MIYITHARGSFKYRTVNNYSYIVTVRQRPYYKATLQCCTVLFVCGYSTSTTFPLNVV